MKGTCKSAHKPNGYQTRGYIYPGALSIRPKILEILGGERMQRKFSGISFQNFVCTAQGCLNISENQNTVFTQNKRHP